MDIQIINELLPVKQYEIQRNFTFIKINLSNGWKETLWLDLKGKLFAAPEQNADLSKVRQL